MKLAQKRQMFVFVELNKSNYADIMFEAQTLSIDRKNNTSHYVLQAFESIIYKTLNPKYM